MCSLQEIDLGRVFMDEINLRSFEKKIDCNIHTYIHTNLYSPKNREKESEALKYHNECR